MPPRLNKGNWSDEEHRLFLEGLETYGKGKWAEIATVVKTRSARQVQTHSFKFFQKKNNELVEQIEKRATMGHDEEQYAETVSNRQDNGQTTQQHGDDDDESNQMSTKRNRPSHSCVRPLPKLPTTKPVPARKDIKPRINSGGWTDEEHRLFLVGLQKYGRGCWMEISRVVRTRTNVQVTNHAKTCLKNVEDDQNLFKGIKVYKRDFEGIEGDEQDDADVETASSEPTTNKGKKPRPISQHVAPTVSIGSSRKRRSMSSTKPATNAAMKPKDSSNTAELNQVFSAPCDGKGLDASVCFSPLLCVDIDLERVEGCIRLEKCGCVVDFYLDSPDSFVHLENVELAIRRRLENAFHTRRKPTAALDDAVYRLVCQETDDLDDILAACERLCECKSRNCKEIVFGEDEVEYWTERSDSSNWNSSPLREFALLRRLALPMCIRTFEPTPKKRRKLSGADKGSTANDDTEVCFPDFSLLDILLQMEIVQGAVIDAVMLRMVQLESVVVQLKDTSKPLVRDLQRRLLASVAEAVGSRRVDHARFVSSAQFMLVASHYPVELKQMVFEFLGHELAERDVGMNQLLKLVGDDQWRNAMASQWKITVARRGGDPLLWTRPIPRPVALAGRSSPPQIKMDGKAAASDEAFVQDVRRVLHGKKDVSDWLAQWGLEKHEKKAEMLVGRNDGSSLLVTQTDMPQETFLVHAELINRANEGFIRRLDRPGSRPRMQALDIPDESMSRIKSFFFDEDGSLRNEIKNDVEMSLKHGYINFQNASCSDERHDKRWQLPIKQHCKVRRVGPRSGLANELENLGIINLLYEQLDDVGLLMGGTEDQSLHHDVSRTFTSFASTTKYDPEEESPISGWEVGRLEYNDAMSSPHAPSSILLGMNDSQKVLLGVQKDQIKRIEGTNQCTIIGGTGQPLAIVCEKEHLVVLEVDKAVMFSGDFPHAGVRNVPEDSPENELLQRLNSKIAAIFQDTTLTKREALDAIVDMLCNFKGLSKLCRLFCSTEMLDGKMKNSKNAVGFSDCFANPPGESCAAIGSKNGGSDMQSSVPQVRNSRDDVEEGDDDSDECCEAYAGSGLLVEAETDTTVPRASSGDESGLSANDFALEERDSTGDVSTNSPQKARVTPTFSYGDTEDVEFFSSPVADKAISPLKAKRRAAASLQDEPDFDDDMIESWAQSPIEPTFGSPMATQDLEPVTPTKSNGIDDAGNDNDIFDDAMEEDIFDDAMEEEQETASLPSPSVKVAATYDEVKAEVQRRKTKDSGNCVIS